ncbi:MAG: radical SAM protein [Bacteroidetes bacterium HGW-Bacteroidetes-17]|nr:MAG: radical SAM protein [Bacteroidetes bacterium HGW-Bacteroidetes-17]
MLDNYKRNINYLRISVTDRCNLRCTYCMPEEGIELLNHKDVLTFDEIVEVVKTGVEYGIDKVRITGGEPLVRKGIIDLISIIWNLEGVKDLSMTTNGILLEKFANDLKKAGLQRVNISLDTLNPQKFKKVTRGGDVEQVFKGIEAAKKAGLYPIKINCVVWKSSDEEDAQEVAKYCKENDLQVRFIHQMNLKTGEFSVVEGGDGGNCSTCNRLRLTANGNIKPCLFSDLMYNVRELGVEEAFKQALGNKPKAGTCNMSGDFYNIGG